MKNKTLKTFIALLLIAVMVSVTIYLPTENKAEASVEYITVEAFAKALVEEIGLSSISGQEGSGYVNALIEKGIIKEGDFSSYADKLTRGDSVMLLSRADDYLNGDKLDPELVQRAIKERISDIGKVTESKKLDVAKGYLKGFMKGYSNGEYCTNRELRVNYKITKAGALSLIKMLKNTPPRAKISPDGQLIRTTNLPKNAKLFPYILASYPNEYYEWRLKYEGVKLYGNNNKEIELINLKDYTSPSDINNLNNERYSNFAAIKSTHINEWVEKARKHLELIFNADYRTINDDWKNKVLETSYAYGTSYEWLPNKSIDKYIKEMKNNNTIVECNKVAVDGSTLYYFNGFFYMRAYVRFRVISSNVSSNVDTDTLIYDKPYEKVLLSNDFVDIRGYKLGKWTEGYFNIELSEVINTTDLGITGTIIRTGKKVN